MGSFADYLENKVLNHVFNKAAYSAPTIYIGLSTADPTDAGTGLAEPSGNNYSRVQTAAGDWNTSTTGALDNANALTFPQASGDWGTITHFAAFDNSSGGNMLFHGQLSASKVIGNGDTFQIPAGALDVSLD